MERSKGMVVGFVAGLAVAGGAVLLLRDTDAARAPDSSRIAELDAQIQRLERAVSRLSGLAITGTPGAVTATVSQDDAAPPTPAASREALKREEAQMQAIVVADNIVDRAVQSGQWTQAQANDLYAATADLGQEEQGRILARVSAAINAGQLQVELP